MACCAYDATTQHRKRCRGVSFKGVAESIINCKKIPGVESNGAKSSCGRGALRPCV